MISKILICEIIDSKKTKPRYLFYPSSSCLSPYLEDNNYSNINIIKQRRKNEEIKGNNNQRNEQNNLYENKIDSKFGKYNFNYKLDSERDKEDIMGNKFSKKYWYFNKTNEEKLKNIPNKEFDVLKNNHMNNLNNTNKKQIQSIESKNLNNNIEMENMNTPFIDNILRNKNMNVEKVKYNINNNDDFQNKIIDKNELYNFYKNIKNENQNKQIFSEKYNIPIIKDDKIENKIDKNNDYLNIIIPQKEDNKLKNINNHNNKLLKNKANIFYKGDGGAKAPIKKRKKSKKKSKK